MKMKENSDQASMLDLTTLDNSRVLSSGSQPIPIIEDGVRIGVECQFNETSTLIPDLTNLTSIDVPFAYEAYFAASNSDIQSSLEEMERIIMSELAIKSGLMTIDGEIANDVDCNALLKNSLGTLADFFDSAGSDRRQHARALRPIDGSNLREGWDRRRNVIASDSPWINFLGWEFGPADVLDPNYDTCAITPSVDIIPAGSICHPISAFVSVKVPSMKDIDPFVVETEVLSQLQKSFKKEEFTTASIPMVEFIGDRDSTGYKEVLLDTITEADGVLQAKNNKGEDDTISTSGILFTVALGSAAILIVTFFVVKIRNRRRAKAERRMSRTPSEKPFPIPLQDEEDSTGMVFDEGVEIVLSPLASMVGSRQKLVPEFQTRERNNLDLSHDNLESVEMVPYAFNDSSQIMDAIDEEATLGNKMDLLRSPEHDDISCDSSSSESSLNDSHSALSSCLSIGSVDTNKIETPSTPTRIRSYL